MAGGEPWRGGVGGGCRRRGRGGGGWRVGWRAVRLGVAVWATCALPAAAQSGGGALVGTVVDQAGAAVPAAMLTITAAGTNLRRTALTSEDGTYVVAGLAPGSYAVR